MPSKQAMELAAEAWVNQRTSHLVMDPIVCEAVAEVIDEILKNSVQNVKELGRLAEIAIAARGLFDNRRGCSDGRSFYGPRGLWYELGAALYGVDDVKVKEMQ